MAVFCWGSSVSVVVLVVGISVICTNDMSRGDASKLSKLYFFSFEPLVLILVSGVDGDVTKHSCAVMWLYLAGGLRCRRFSGRNPFMFSFFF